MTGVGSEEKRQEDGQNGLTYVSGSSHPVGGGIQTADDRRRIIPPGETASESTVSGVRGGDGVGVAVSPPKDTAQEGNAREMSLGYHGPRRRATHL